MKRGLRIPREGERPQIIGDEEIDRLRGYGPGPWVDVPPTRIAGYEDHCIYECDACGFTGYDFDFYAFNPDTTFSVKNLCNNCHEKRSGEEKQ